MVCLVVVEWAKVGVVCLNMVAGNLWMMVGALGTGPR